MIFGQVKTKVFSTRLEAKKWEAAQSAEKWTEENSLTITICLHEFATAYLDWGAERFAPRTVGAKKLAFRRLFQFASPVTLPENLTPAMVLPALRSVAVKVSGYAANTTRKHLSAAWEWGKKYCSLPRLNPFQEVEPFPADKTPRYVPPEEDFWKVWDCAGEDDKAMLLLMLHTGARRGEVFRLRWEDVDFHGGKIRFGTRKTGHGGMEYAWLPMTGELHEILGAYRQRHSGTGSVFASPLTGEPYTTRKGLMRALCRRAGVKPFGFHAIRHLSATILAYDGLDIPTLQAVLRHKNPNTTARYIKSLGVQPDKMNRVFLKRKRGTNVVPFAPLDKAIGT
jgi:integrase